MVWILNYIFLYSKLCFSIFYYIKKYISVYIYFIPRGNHSKFNLKFIMLYTGNWLSNTESDEKNVFFNNFYTYISLTFNGKLNGF